MSTKTTTDRLAQKTPEASLFHILQSEFNFSRRESREVVNVAHEMLGLDQPKGQIRPGQIRMVVASLSALESCHSSSAESLSGNRTP
jgi:hypothetical protein